MDILFLIFRVVLALVFIVSGVAKLRDLGASRLAMQDFGMPAPLAQLAGVGLPFVELIVAVLLVPSLTAWWGASGALLLLVVFSSAIAYQLARGRRPECHCFGTLDSAPIGRRTLFRNGALSVMALAVIVYHWGDVQLTVVGVHAGMSAMTLLILAVGACLLGLVIFQAWITVEAYRRLSRRLADLTAAVSATNGRARRRLMGEIVPPSVGEPAPILELPDLSGTLVDLTTLRGRVLLLVFVRPGCWACHALVPALVERVANPAADRPYLIVISRGTAAENVDLAGIQAPVLLAPNGSVAQAFGVGGTPAALHLDADGMVATDVVVGIGPVSTLMNPVPEQPEIQSSDATSDETWRQRLVTSMQRIVSVLRGANA